MHERREKSVRAAGGKYTLMQTHARTIKRGKVTAWTNHATPACTQKKSAGAGGANTQQGTTIPS